MTAKRWSLSSLRESLAFRRKVRAAGLRIVGTGMLPVEAIVWIREDRPQDKPLTVRELPHLALLSVYRVMGLGVWIHFHGTPYHRWHVALRGYQHPRPDAWIEAMARRLVRLYEDMRANGYRCDCVADRIAVVDGCWLWDGGHRLACLAALGWTEVPVVNLVKR